jgi:hypothetical protein
MNSGFNNSQRPPAEYGRKQFEREAGDRQMDEEYAAELMPTVGAALPRSGVSSERRTEHVDPMADLAMLVQDEGDVVTQNKSLGIVALVLSAISLFFLPAILGPASIVVGFAAYVRGSRVLGIWSMALGLLAVVAYFVLVPYYA